MEWLKSSNVIVVTKSVTAIEVVVTRYLLTSRSEGITIDGNVWSEVRPNPTSENRYVWAYETYHYTDRTARNTSPYILDEYQSPKFEVDFSSDSYEIHPRWSNTSYITFRVTKLNGLTGDITITQTSSSRGIGLPIYDSSSDSYSISIENKSTTSTSFSFTISIGNCVETFEIKGIMVDADSKYLGTVSILPNPNVCVEGDRCFYRPTDNEGSLYIYDSESSSWKSIDNSGLSVTEKNLIYTEAMKDIIDNIPANSSILSQYGFFNTVIASIIKAGTSFVDEMYAKKLDVEDGNFKLEITSEVIKVSYNGNTVFQIDPSSGNVFFGKPNSGLSAPLSGFMYDAANQRIISKDNKLTIGSDGTINATDGYFGGTINATDGSFSGSLIGASGLFNGSFITPSLESRPPKVTTPTATITLTEDAISQFNALYNVINATYQCSLSSDSSIKYISEHISVVGRTSYHDFHMFDSNMVKKYYNSKMVYDPIFGSAEITYNTTIPAGTLSIGATGDVLVFKVDKIPYSSEGLEVGQIYQNSNHQLFIKT